MVLAHPPRRHSTHRAVEIPGTLPATPLAAGGGIARRMTVASRWRRRCGALELYFGG